MDNATNSERYLSEAMQSIKVQEMSVRKENRMFMQYGSSIIEAK